MHYFRSCFKVSVLFTLLIAAQNASADSLTAFGVNANGLIVGGDSTTGQAFLYNPAGGSFTFISVPGASITVAYGINTAGEVVGTYYDSLGNGLGGFTWTGGLPSTIFAGSGASVAGINSNGDIVGAFVNSSGLTEGYIFTHGGLFTPIMDGNFTIAFGINNFGEVSGYYITDLTPPVSRQGFTYNGSFTTADCLGATQSVVQGINDFGIVVGTETNGGIQTGFIYSGGVCTPISYPNASSTQLYGINDAGEVVGSYSCPSGNCPLADPAFFAIPTATGYEFTTIPSPTPEPGSFALLGSGFLAVLCVTRLRALIKLAYFSTMRSLFSTPQ